MCNNLKGEFISEGKPGYIALVSVVVWPEFEMGVLD